MDTKQEQLDLITVDYAGFHGPIASAMVTHNNGWDSTPFLHEVLMLGYYCESEDHEEDSCVCVTEEVYKESYIANISRLGLVLVEDAEG